MKTLGSKLQDGNHAGILETSNTRVQTYAAGQRIALLAFLVVISQAAAVAWAQQPRSNYRHLKEYGEMVVGRFLGSGTLTDDLPGLGKKDEKITGHATTAWILDRNAIQCDWSFGTAAGKWIAFWDAGEGKIRRIGMNTAGDSFVAVVSQKDGKWVEEVNGSAEGTSYSSTDTWRIAGDTLTIVESDVKIGGEERPGQQHQWKRVGR